MKQIIQRWVGKFSLAYSNNLLLKRLSTVLAIDMLMKVSGFLLLPLYLRLMTQEEYGLFGYLLSIIFTFSLVLGFGLTVPLSKYYHDHKDPQARGRLVFTIFILLAALLFLFLFPVYITGFDYKLVKLLFSNPFDYKSYRGFIIISVVAAVCNTMLTSYFYTSEKIKEVKNYNIWRIIGINVFSMAMLYVLKDKDGAVVRLAVAYLAELLLFAIYMYYPIKEMVAKFDWKLAGNTLRLAMPVMLSPIFGIVINFSDKFFLEKHSNSFQTLSTYYLGVSCASIIPTIFTSVQNAWFPLFIKEKDVKRNVAKTNKISLRLLLIFAALSAFIVLGVWIVLKLNIIQQHYYQVVFVLPIMLMTQILISLTNLYSNYLVYFEKTKVISFAGLVVCCISLVLGLTLVPIWGMYGAALSSFLANLVFLAIYFVMAKKYTKNHLIMS